MSRFADHKQPGFEAVQARYGEAVVQRMRNWPRLTENWLLASGYDRPKVDELVEATEQAVKHAAADKEFALDQAQMIVRWMGTNPNDLLPVPSVTQLLAITGSSVHKPEGCPACNPEAPNPRRDFSALVDQTFEPEADE